MKIEVTITRTDDGASTKVKSQNGEASKNHASWNAALKEAENSGLISSLEAMAAKALPPGFPLHTSTDIEAANLETLHFKIGKASPPQ